MQVQLIPVVELFYPVGSVPTPATGPYWEHVDSWQDYQSRSLLANGFSPGLKPYRAGAALYRLAEMSDEDIAQLASLHCAGGLQISGDWEQVCPLSGGYVLRLDNSDLFYPQCCSDLRDLQSWRQIAQGKGRYLYSGHPSPVIRIERGTITFDFSEGDMGEAFAPPPARSSASFPLVGLAVAVQTAELELQTFAVRLERLNAERHLNIPNIRALLL
ncbi:hypothetical protein [Pseudomonas nitroreducens]|uniref:hypothetical protein n=1 Tax=Pseudomonas nitroreducens TaxID=46680 RepID=UPI002D80E381|nr:hypothetical protein [Pseudomonas nitroreducens]